MKTRLVVLGACAVVSALAAAPLAAAPAQVPHVPTQQEKFAACAHESKGIRGEARRHFMSDCLRGRRGGAQASNADPERARIRACTATAGERKLQGEERRAFMVSCMKG